MTEDVSTAEAPETLSPEFSTVPVQWLPTITRGPGYLDITTSRAAWSHTASTADKHEEGEGDAEGAEKEKEDEDACLSYSNIWQAVDAALNKHPEREFLGAKHTNSSGEWNPYEWMTFGQAKDAIETLATRFHGWGITKGEYAAIVASNSPEWLLSLFAMTRQGIVGVPLYPSFGPSALTDVFRTSKIRLAVSDIPLLDKLLTAAEEVSVPLTYIILTAGTNHKRRIPVAQKRRAAQLGITLIYWHDAISRESLSSKEKEQSSAAPAEATTTTTTTPSSEGFSVVPPADTKPDDLFMTLFTSGTMNVAKGAIIKHSNALVSMASIRSSFLLKQLVPDEQVHMSYLPLCHVFELCTSLVVTICGSKIGFTSGVMARILTDIVELKPTFLIGVPRVWRKLQDKILQKINGNSFWARLFYAHAYTAKAETEATGKGTWINWDWWVFQNFRDALGGSMKVMISGGAPIPGDLAAWMRRTFGVDVYQVFGMTEVFTAATMSVAPYSGDGIVDIGVPSPWCRVRLMDCPDLSYLTTDDQPRGELLLSGPTMFAGYTNDPDKAEKVMVDGEWLRTGDIACINSDGTLTIIDRQKSLFKLTQGEFVPADYLETIFNQSPLVSQIWVHCESTDSFTIAIVVPDAPELAQSLGLDPNMPATELCARSDANEHIRDELERILNENQLPRFMITRGVILEAEPFTEENGLLTPSLKLRRANLRQKYGEKIALLRQSILQLDE